ncbi:UDP-4-amino-4,6-dideoxy-N-acetyl-beta-L-altrosamine transaminase [Gammaproteobacteria bacterium]|nr:UDP-4-amino-4,6-dideoxy-N-acetyl-beta-L-altrosamine transaminase [Gammaproteobacteria bacterium]
MKKNFLPYNSQQLDKSDIKSVMKALKSPYLTTGPIADEFEKELAKYLGVKYAVVCANGTAALHLSMLALGIGYGDKVVTSPISFVADANAPRFCGADVIFADIEPSTVNLDPQEVRKVLKREKNVKAIIPVHFAGQPCRMDEFGKIAEEFNLKIVEDGCHALGGSYIKNNKPVKVGSCADSDLTTFSFHPIKNITTGEGGAITTNDKNLYKKLRLLRSHGNTRNSDEFVTRDLSHTNFNQSKLLNPWYYEMQHLSYNYRLTDFQAALGKSQLKKLDKFINKRNELSNLYDKLFEELDHEKILPLDNLQKGIHGRHLYVVRIPMDQLDGGRAKLMMDLLENGIQTQVHYIPIYLQPNYQEYFKRKLHFPFSEEYYKNCLSLPLFVGMTKKDVRRVVQSLNNILDKNWNQS